MIGWIVCLILLTTDQWVLGPALFVFLAALHVLAPDDGPPVAMAAFAYQWLQVTIALWYAEFTGRQVVEMKLSHYQPMVLIGLASISVLFGGYWIVRRGTMRKYPLRMSESVEPATVGAVGTTYIVAIVLSLLIQKVAWSLPGITQLLFMLGFARYALLYVLITRLMKPTPRWSLISLVVCAEVAIGFGGYFASFRESLVFIGIAIVVSTRNRKATTWLAGGVLAIAAFYTAVTWTAIKPQIRKQYSYSASTSERISRVLGAIGPAVLSPSKELGTHVDKMVSRLWQVYYPSLALERVPAVVPHSNGVILREAISNTLMPRAFFPEKGILPSESEKVRKYTGVHVAGRETGTSFAFGYAAEAYVDFGWPLMLVPIFAFGCLIGYAGRLMSRLVSNEKVLQAMRVVFIWSSMYLFEVSWVMMIGTMVSLLIVLVSAGVLFERTFHRALAGDRRFAIRLSRASRRQNAPDSGPIRGNRGIRAG